MHHPVVRESDPTPVLVTLYMRRHQQQQQNAIILGKHVFINLTYVSTHFEQIKLVCSNRGLST
jgi:hypothetical protein